MIVGGNRRRRLRSLCPRACCAIMASTFPGGRVSSCSTCRAPAASISRTIVYTRAPKDGLTIGMIFPGVIVGPLLDERMEARTFKPTEFVYLGSANVNIRVCATYRTSKTQTFDDALAHDTTGWAATRPAARCSTICIFCGARSARSSRWCAATRAAYDILLSMERQEVEGICGLDWSSLQRSGRIGSRTSDACDPADRDRHPSDLVRSARVRTSGTT